MDQKSNSHLLALLHALLESERGRLGVGERLRVRLRNERVETANRGRGPMVSAMQETNATPFDLLTNG